MGHGRIKPLDLGENPDHVMLGLWSWYGSGCG